MRAGRRYDHGFFGGGLADAVAGVPEAEAHARSYEGLRIGGFFFVLGSGASSAAAIVAAGAAVSSAGAEPGTADLTVTYGLLAGSAVMSIVGWSLYASSEPHFWDAINVFNDETQRQAVKRWRERRPPTP